MREYYNQCSKYVRLTQHEDTIEYIMLKIGHITIY